MRAILEPRPELAPPATPLVEDLSPALDPWEVARRLANRRHLLFLDSSSTDSPFGRYSFVTADPFEWISTRGPDDPFPRLTEALGRFRMDSLPGLPPFQGGAAGLFGYDLCHYLEQLPRPGFDEFETPDLAVGFYDWVVAFDHQARRSWIISTGF